jgi:hypothetical protein
MQGLKQARFEKTSCLDRSRPAAKSCAMVAQRSVPIKVLLGHTQNQGTLGVGIPILAPI